MSHVENDCENENHNELPAAVMGYFYFGV